MCVVWMYDEEAWPVNTSCDNIGLCAIEKYEREKEGERSN